MFNNQPQMSKNGKNFLKEVENSGKLKLVECSNVLIKQKYKFYAVEFNKI